MHSDLNRRFGRAIVGVLALAVLAGTALTAVVFAGGRSVPADVQAVRDELRGTTPSTRPWLTAMSRRARVRRRPQARWAATTSTPR